jgi:2-dehydropantoate 2-reductase
MKVSVIVPGAMGCLFAARLNAAGLKTTLVDHNPDRAKRLESSGITVTRSGDRSTESVSAVSSVPKGQDLCIVLVKSYNTDNLELPSDTPILTLQNGLGNVETICSKAGSSMVLAGATEEAATLVGEGEVEHNAEGMTRVGSWTSCPVEPAMEALTKAGFQVEVTEAPGQTIWEKVTLNAGINPITALLDIPNGGILEKPEVRQLMRDLVVEAAKVATTEGYRFPYSLVERAEEVCETTRENISSMLQDIRAGKPTEIEAISGEILSRGQLAGLPMPRTRVIYQLVKGLR